MKKGILLTNVGTPDQPTAKSVRQYLKEFLLDKRVVEIPKIFWYPILYGYILPFRSHSSAALYQTIWTEEGSPLKIYSQKIAKKLKEKTGLPVELGMHYGNPSILSSLEKLQHLDKIIFLPLFPQYCATTTAASFDIAAKTLNSWRNIPAIEFVNDYADNPDYINAIAHSIDQYWKTNNKPDHLLFSFHGIPKRFADLGDVYPKRCLLTAELIAKQLNLSNDKWSIAFQSRIGRAKWLTPYTDIILKSLPKKNCKHVHVICPGFSVDCLETLEEIAIRGKEQFLNAGGNEFHYIPALNETDAHINLLMKMLT